MISLCETAELFIHIDKISYHFVMDALETRLLELLSENARASVAALARELGTARATVRERMDRLERRGIIRGYTIRHAPDYRANLISAHVMIETEPKKTARICRELQAMPKVRSLYSISGQFDLIAVVREASTRDLDDKIDAIGAVDGVIRTMTSVLLSTKFER